VDVVKIVDFADVILFVGEKVRLHVSKAVVSLASKPLKAMFKPEWIGQARPVFCQMCQKFSYQMTSRRL